MRLQDLRPSERTQVSAGLPAGSLDNAIGQLRELAHSSLLPPCAPHPRRRSPRPPARTGAGTRPVAHIVGHAGPAQHPERYDDPVHPAPTAETPTPPTAPTAPRR